MTEAQQSGAEDGLLQRYLSWKQSLENSPFPISHQRDLLLAELAPSMLLVVACDSDGGIGPKEHDTFPAPAFLLGRLAVRVPLMEIAASGALPLLVVDALAVEMDPTGKEIIAGVRHEVNLSGMDGSKVVTGSTEDNVPTVATGMGIVIVGIAHRGDLRPGSSQPGDKIICVGLPKSAPDDEVNADDPEIANVACVRTLATLDVVHDILPVGSHGCGYEMNEMASTAGLQAVVDENTAIPTNKSAGPSTCVLASVSPEGLEVVQSAVQQPVHVMGEMKA